MDVKIVPVNMFGAENISRLAEKGMHSREDVVKRVRDTFTPGMDCLQRGITQQGWVGCECYTNYQITTPMPKSLFGDSFGYDMQKDIGNHMRDYYDGKMSDNELNQYFNDCCTEMRKYQAQCHRSSGNVDEDNQKIISQVYEIFAKENARAALRTNYDEGAAINKKYGHRNYDWVYYNSDYYYQCEDVREALGTMANEMAEKWGASSIDTEEIERNSSLTLDGGFDFNSGWNVDFRNQAGRASMADEATEPPRDFKFFYKEHLDGVSKMEMWVDRHQYKKDIPFFLAPGSLKGQIYQADNIMEEFKGQIGDVKGYSKFMNQLSLFTGWYAWQTGINNRFGNYVPDGTYWQYG